MKRLFVVSMLSLALAGCAQSRGAVSRGASSPPSPLAVTPVPSIYDTVNQGVGGPAIAKTAIGNPDDPHWSGRAQVSVAARPVPAGAPSAAAGPARAPATSPGPGPAAPIAARPTQSPAPPAGESPAMAASVAPPAVAPTGRPIDNALAASPSPADPAAEGPSAAGLPGLASAPAPGPRTAASGSAAADAGGIPIGAENVGPKPIAPLPADVSISPSASSSPATLASTPQPQSQVPKRNSDPLLGPDPDLMPPMPDLPPLRAAAKPALAGRGPSSPEAAPASATSAPRADGPPALEPAPVQVPSSSPLENPAEPPAASPGAAGAQTPADPPISLEKSTAVSKPAPAGLLAADLPLEPAPPSNQVPPTVTARAIAPLPARLTRDPHVVLTSAHDPQNASPERMKALKEPGRPVARVGDEIITYHDLVVATKENLRKYPELRARGFNSAEQIQVRKQIDMLARETLAGLIDRSLLIQEAKRHIKDKKNLDRAFEEADRVFREEEVLPLERQYTVDSEQKLKEKLAEEGRSLDAMRQSFQRYFLAESYLHEKLRDKLKVELPDLLRYYNEHVHEHEFDRPAQISWRELVVEVENHKSRDEARKKADDLLEKLRRGADFATLARAESDGPTSSRSQGGLMQTSPGSYAVKPINLALDSLPIGQLSGVLEGPDSFHILKVENRRPAGPASFEEVQDKIRPIIVNKKFREERTAFIAKLQRNALISIYNLSMNDTDKTSR